MKIYYECIVVLKCLLLEIKSRMRKVKINKSCSLFLISQHHICYDLKFHYMVYNLKVLFCMKDLIIKMQGLIVNLQFSGPECKYVNMY